MSDTLQLVLWGLGFQCKLREKDAITNPQVALTQLSRARTFSNSPRRNNRSELGIFGDIYVTGTCSAAVFDGNGALPRRAYPDRGYFISQQFANCNSPESMQAMCAHCPANTRPSHVARCVGTLRQSPDSREIEDQFQGILSRLNLIEDYGRIFPKTAPHWYGLWARSPLPPEVLPLLRVIFSEMLNEDRQALLPKPGTRTDSHLRDLSEFIRATELAEQQGLQLWVSLLPPGHADLGFYTIFPHCPFCKAAAQVPRWQRKYSDDPLTCEVCGTIFSSAATASSQSMDFDDEPDLRRLLGQAEFEKFAKEYLIAQGTSEDEASRMVVATENLEQARQQKATEQRNRAKLQQRYVLEELCHGLEMQPANDENNGVKNWPPKFKAEDFAELLRRCKERKIVVTALVHQSPDGGTDKFETRLSDPAEVFRLWQAEGCEDLYSAVFRVPDELLKDRPI